MKISTEELNLDLLETLDRVPTAAQQLEWSNYLAGSTILSTSNRPTQYQPRDYYAMGRRTIWENYKDTVIGIPDAGSNDWSSVVTLVPYHTATEDSLTQVAYCKGGTYTRTSVGTVTETTTWSAWSKYSTFSGNYDDLTNKPTITDYTLPIAKHDILGGVMPDNTSITVDNNGVVKAAVTTAMHTSLEQRVNDLFTSVSNAKVSLANAITDKGVDTATDATFATMIANVAQLGSLKFATMDFKGTSYGNTTSIETSIVADMGFPIEYAVVLYKNFKVMNDNTHTGYTSVYSKDDPTNQLYYAGGMSLFSQSLSVDGVVIPFLMSDIQRRTRIDGNAVILESTYYSSLPIPAQDLNITVLAFG